MRREKILHSSIHIPSILLIFWRVNKKPCNWFLPVRWLLVIGADGCLVVMADTYLVRRAAHLQTGVLGGIWTYRERSGTDFISEQQKNVFVERRRINATKHQTVLLVFQLADSYILLTEADRKIMSWSKRRKGRMVKDMK